MTLLGFEITTACSVCMYGGIYSFRIRGYIVDAWNGNQG